MTSIGNYAFSRCSSLTSVTIGNSVTSIGNDAFWGCSSLTSIKVETGNTKLDSRNDCNAIIETATNTLIAGCKNTTIPNSVTSIGNYAFSGCSSLTSVTIPNSVTSIGLSAFKGCSGLKSITIPNSVTSIGDSAFSGCSGLTSITIPNSVTSISDFAFSGCTRLTSITIPNSVTSIGQYAFSGCSGLTSVTIPNSVTSIGNYAFNGCKLHNILVKSETPPSFKDNTFTQNMYNHTSLYIPNGSWDDYVFGSNWYQFINIRETALTEEQVSMQQAYTLMDANTFTYSVYDPVNNCIGTISSVGINEDNPNHSWQVIESDGNRYLYNLGAKKFVASSANGSYTLSDAPAPINMADGDNGIILGTQTARQWALVSNESMSVGISPTPALSEGEGEWYSLDGKRLDVPQKGINIIRYSDGTTRKVLVK